MGSGRPYRGKRFFDLAVLVLVAVPACAVGVVCGLAVRLTSSGPVFFRQERIGMGGEPFKVWKFRTMAHGDNPMMPDPDRITTVGGVLRRLSLDELPQLLNVARGEMSIVGPRPTLAYQIERYDDHQRRRLAVRPGLTGLARGLGPQLAAVVGAHRLRRHVRRDPVADRGPAPVGPDRLDDRDRRRSRGASDG